MAKLLKHFGLGGKKATTSTQRAEFSNSTTQKSNSVNELGSCKYQSNTNFSTGGSANNHVNVNKASPDYDTRSLKLNLDDNNKGNAKCTSTNGQPKPQYSSLQKNAGSKSDVTTDLDQQQKQQRRHHHHHQQQYSQQSSPQNETTATIIKPDIQEEYCDPHDFTSGEVMTSAPADDDYSTPYDEVNKVLKDLKAHKSCEGLNVTSQATPANTNISTTLTKEGATKKQPQNSSANGEDGTKVPLKLTSPSTITAIHVKQKMVKDSGKNGSEEDDDDLNDVTKKTVTEDIKTRLVKIDGIAGKVDGNGSNEVTISKDSLNNDNEDDDDDHDVDDDNDGGDGNNDDDDDGGGGGGDDDECNGDVEEEEEDEEVDEIKNHEYTVFMKDLEGVSSDDATNQEDDLSPVTVDTETKETKGSKNAQDNCYSSLTLISCKNLTSTNQTSDNCVSANHIDSDVLLDDQLTNQINCNELAPSNESEDLIIASQSYLSNCTSGGLVTIVTTNHLQDFEPIECDLVLSVNETDQSKYVSKNITKLDESVSNHNISSVETSNSSDQSCQTAINQSVDSIENNNQSSCEKINRVIKSNKIRPKSDSILISQCIESSNKQFKKNNKNKNNNNNNNNNNLANGFESCVKVKYNKKKIVKKAMEQDGLAHQGWYHGSIGRVEAERLLERQSVGSYLVRVSESNNKHFSLSLKNQSGYLHIKIVHQPVDGYILGQFSQPFDTIGSMIDYYQLNNLPIRGNENLKLLNPLIVEVL